MTTEQILSLVRALLLATGTVLTTLGVIGPEDWGSVVNGVMAIVGALIGIIPIVWSMFTHSKSGIIKATSRLPEVQEIIIRPQPVVLSDKVKSERGK